MSVVDVAPVRPQGSVEAKAAVRVRKPRRKATDTSTPQCLILSNDGLRRDEFVKTASASGWDVVSCSDAEAARGVVQRGTFQLIFIDLESAGEEAASVYREFGEGLAADSDGLLVVCGGGGDPLEEIWARKVGTWFYLPGVAGCEAIAMLCVEAKVIVDKKSRKRRRSTSPHNVA